MFRSQGSSFICFCTKYTLADSFFLIFLNLFLSLGIIPLEIVHVRWYYFVVEKLIAEAVSRG